MEGVKGCVVWGVYEVNTTSDACISAINTFYHQVLSYGRERSVILEATVHDPHCLLANILAAHFLSSSNPSRAPSHLAAAKNQLEHASAYEKAVFDAISYLFSENKDDDVVIELHSKNELTREACPEWQDYVQENFEDKRLLGSWQQQLEAMLSDIRLLEDFPRDLVSLKRAQVLSFYMGRPDLTLNLVQQVLSENEQENYIHGMLAFALLELGRMHDAEAAARKGFSINKQDLWSQHALCHVLQYECRFKEAVEFMEQCSSSWKSCMSFMYTHNWWHVALCYLEGHSPINKVLEIYDHHIWKELERPDASPPEVYLNAVGLLLRIFVRDEIDIFEDRLKVLAECLKEKTVWYIEWHLDVLILWALAKTGDIVSAEELFNGLKSRISSMSKKKRESMQRAIKLSEAMYEYGRGNYEEVLGLLGHDFDASDCKMIGASDEQLDVFNEVYFCVLLNTGRAERVIELLEKRLKQREGVPFLWRLMEKAYLTTDKLKAATASKKAGALETTYFM